MCFTGSLFCIAICPIKCDYGLDDGLTICTFTQDILRLLIGWVDEHVRAQQSIKGPRVTFLSYTGWPGLPTKEHRETCWRIYLQILFLSVNLQQDAPILGGLGISTMPEAGQVVIDRWVCGTVNKPNDNER